MNNFYKGGRGMACGHSDKVTELRSNQSYQTPPKQKILNSLSPKANGLWHLTYSLQFKIKSLKSIVYGLLLLFVSMFSLSDAWAQSAESRTAERQQQKEVSIGHSVPKDFWTKEYLFYINGDTVRKSLEEHKGKMLVLDFWSSGCAPCFIHQKEIRWFAERYKDDLVVVMVNSLNTRDTYEKLDGLYHKGHFEKFGLQHFESIVADDYLISLFPYTSFPHYVWINGLGRLQLRTFRNLLDRNYVAPFIDKR
ncbi:TlpA family protein disulfide reductase [Sphingobacterium wenxiniae]|uniref:Thiol-disulfide isomerase or thioredoxin n=1 Tax=Sphingobacterium wenxiniae TaxID=683125 RepID=A0A1I6U9Q1_9SPHI|nr:hypothetical protein [Sphingobacterium wenxiniae]SFS98249.1 hypothetical protein SAMN05660206_10878 [Sphingobacterium wenxiniae]